jgi:ribonuclease III
MSLHPNFTEARTHIEQLLSYRFNNAKILEKALRAFPCFLSSGEYVDGNKGIAVVGDAALQLIVTTNCYVQGLDRGTASIRFQSPVKNEALGNLEAAKKPEENQCVFLAPGTTVTSTYMRATTVEAVLGAVYLDSGWDMGVARRACVQFGILDQ